VCGRNCGVVIFSGVIGGQKSDGLARRAGAGEFSGLGFCSALGV
jgi:hypothetical protein